MGVLFALLLPSWDRAPLTLQEMRLKLLTLSLGVVLAASQPPSPSCQAGLDAVCNANTACVEANRKGDFALPLVARLDLASKSTATKAWRCYSPSSLSADLAHYTGGKAYCSGPGAVLESALALCESGAKLAVLNATAIWSSAETKRCGDIRTPQLVATAGPVGKVLLFAQCREAVLIIAAGGGDGSSNSSSALGDNFVRSRMVVKESLDWGASWGVMRFVTGADTGVGVATLDRTTGALVLQYQIMPVPTDPYRGNTLLQVVSADEGATWSAPRDITPQIAHCNNNPASSEMMCGGAGSRIQTASGRLIFSGHNKDSVCVWFSDDHGATYQTMTSEPFVGNEQSIAQLGDGSLYMNGRGTQFAWRGNRTEYRSVDNGATWSAGAASQLTDVECEAALIAVKSSSAGAKDGTALFFSEPTGPGRISNRLHCSCDGGVSWPASVVVNPGAPAAYSSLLAAKGKLLAVWEARPGMWGHIFNVDWCPCA